MRRDISDLAAGAILAAIGFGAAAYALNTYDFGTLRRMGPGFFPAVLGGGLGLLGLAIALPEAVAGRAAARDRGVQDAADRQDPGTAEAAPGQPTRAVLPEMAAVLGAILIFALGLERAGLAVSTAAAVLLATLAAPRPGIGWRLGLTAIVTALSVMVFHVGLKMTAPLWPVWGPVWGS